MMSPEELKAKNKAELLKDIEACKSHVTLTYLESKASIAIRRMERLEQMMAEERAQRSS